MQTGEKGDDADIDSLMVVKQVLVPQTHAMEKAACQKQWAVLMPNVRAPPGLPDPRRHAGGDSEALLQHALRGGGFNGGKKSKFSAAKFSTGKLSTGNSFTYKATSTTGNLSTNLHDLESVEPDRIVIARKINRLGFKSAALLERHFSWYGTVERVLVAHSRVTQSYQHTSDRMRPSSIGFVVMDNREAAEEIFRDGPEQCIQCDSTQGDVTIYIQRFESRTDSQGGD